MRKMIPVAVAVLVGLFACGGDSPTAVQLEEPFDSVPVGCYADTVVVNGQVQFICP